jgi:hypothetical protein
MYTLSELDSKTFGELKKIGYELNVLPEDDRRRRQSWIDAIVGVNPPLLQLLETSPAPEVQAQELPIIETVEASPAAEDLQAQEPPIQSKFGRIVYPRPSQKAIDLLLDEELPSEEEARSIVSQYFISTSLREIRNAPPPARVFSPGQYVRIIEVLECSNSPFCGSIGIVEGHYFNVWVWVELDGGGRKIVVCRPEGLELIELVVEESATKQQIENSPGVEIELDIEERLPDCVMCFDDGCLEDESGLIKSCPCSIEPKLSRQNAQRVIAPTAKNLPGSRSKTSTDHQLLELFQSSAHIIEDSSGVKTEATVSESAIAPFSTKNHIEDESDLNPILTGITLSDRFIARYSPPQAENIRFQLEADGQLSLLDFEVKSEPEPPDPDDFESLDAFKEALARWDAENVEMLAPSMDSICEWAPCPEEWYEQEAENLPLKASSMRELSSPAIESSSTSDFFLPTFGAEGDRQKGKDEPPDTGGIFARLPRPKPPNFPPQAASWTQVEHTLDKQVSLSQPKSGQVSLVSRSYPETIPKLSPRVVAGSSTQPARSPPGGDAMS